VAALVAELDRTVPQVVVQALIAEVPAGFLADCGLTADGGCFTLSARELALFQAAFRNYPNRSVLSRPQLQVSDNRTANVQVGGGVPAGGAQPTSVGVSLRVTPRVMPDGKVQLRVEPQICTPNPTPVVLRTGATAFPINIQTAQTTTLVPSGGTVVIATPTTGADGKPAAMLFVLTPAVVQNAPW
jgi:type II secretory pathway component GspD/PulD (secretin)